MRDLKDDRGVPISAGIPRIVVVAVFIGIFVILALLGMVFGSAGFGHAWPSSTSTQIRL